MPTLALSPELQSKIVHSLSSSPTQTTTTLHALCLTSKSFYREAEPHLYASLSLTSPQQAYLACRTLAANKRLAKLVRAFWFNDETQNRNNGHGLPRRFWEGIRSALAGMKKLQRLCLFDTELSNAWILDPAGYTTISSNTSTIAFEPPFQLHEAKLHFTWDTHLVSFLSTQRALNTLQTFDIIEDAVPRLPLPEGSLPLLQRFDGTLMVAHNILRLGCPLTNLQAAIEDGVHAPEYVLGFLRRLAGVGKTLKALSVLEMPEGLAGDAVDIIVSLCPNLMYIGLVPLPPVHRHTIYAPLTRLRNLHTAHFDLTTWTPHPEVRAQRAIACEVRTFCPGIANVVFWVGNTRTRWTWVVQQGRHHCYEHGEKREVGQWHSQMEVGQYPTFDHMWSLV
ncbi:hypothetical protein E4T56_gene20502 [Termitomyces sp. T112]|nr:hypothetical protein E4T56_gene20502 [Termitomyces sp. T112]